jgi:hypothetical protein
MLETEKMAHIEDKQVESSSLGDGENVAVVVGDIKPKVHFNLIQTLGMAFSITAPPIAMGLYLNLIIGVGGTPFYIWALLFVIFFQMVTCFAIAEMASAIPHSSGILLRNTVAKVAN